MKPDAERCQVIDIQKQVEEKVRQEQEKYEDIEPQVSNLSSQEILKGLKNNEDGDAWLFRQLKKDRLCFDHGKRLWHVWSGNYWVEDDVDNALAEVEAVVDAYAAEANRQAKLKIENTRNGNQDTAKQAESQEKELLARISLLQTVRRKKNVLILASSGEGSLGISGDEWDSDPFLLGCKNGVVDLRTGRARAGMPGDYIKTAAPIDWMGLDAQAPCFEKTLREIFNDDQQIIDFVQRLFGLAMSGLSNERIFPILIGSGHNGKGTLIETIAEVTGGLSGPIQAEMLLKQSFTRSSAGPSPDIMSLQGKRLVWASETEEGRQLNVAKVKWLVGGDTLVGRHVQGKKEIK
jgi:putative DNA primase/helicase